MYKLTNSQVSEEELKKQLRSIRKQMNKIDKNLTYLKSQNTETAK